MLSQDLQARLEALHRAPEPAPSVESNGRAALPVTQSVGLRDGFERQTAWGKHWWIEQSLDRLWPAAAECVENALRPIRSWPDETSSELYLLASAFPQDIVLLDLETCGLAGSMIFLAGLLHEQHGRLQLTQLWARDYSEEKALLQSLWNIVHSKQLLITFNGKSFDWPQVHDRSTLHHLGFRRPVDPRMRTPRRASVARDEPGKTIAREPEWSPSAGAESGATVRWQRVTNRIDSTADLISEPTETRGSAERLTRDQQRPEPQHVDLLHHARRRWRHQLPNCRLQTLERYICGRQRQGDIPGREIPGAYHDYVRDGCSPTVEAILHHNALDLVTLFQLMLTFLDRISKP